MTVPTSRFRILDRPSAEAGTSSREEAAFDDAPVLASFLDQSGTISLLRGDREGRLTTVNDAFARSIQVPAKQLLGGLLWPLLAESEVEAMRERLRGDLRTPRVRFEVHFLAADGLAFTLVCQLDVQPGYFVLVGEPPASDVGVGRKLLDLDNDLAVLARERARECKELARAQAQLRRTLTDLQTSHWHLRKIQEVLPICMECCRVETAELKWDSVADYFKEHALFLSHGYCPECVEKVLERYRSEL